MPRSTAVFRARFFVFALLAAALPSLAARAEPLASGLAGSVGSTVGPDKAIYVTEGAAGRISRVDRHTGRVTTFAEGLGLAPVLAIGLLTRPAAIVIAITMLVAAFLGEAGNPFSDREAPLLFAAIAIYFVLAGPGRYSVDGWLAARRF